MKGILAATAIAVGLSGGHANAACTQEDIGGTWEFYGDISSPFLPFDQALRCTVHIEKTTGTMAASSPCASSGIGGGTLTPGTVASGTATLGDAENCTFNIAFHAVIGRIIPVSVQHATMSLSKDVVAGLVRADMGGSTFTMVKIR